MCTNYEVEVETNDHLLIYCNFEKFIWENIFRWCNMDYVQKTTVKDIIKVLMDKFYSLTRRRLVHAIFSNSLGDLARNELVFNGRTIPL